MTTKKEFIRYINSTEGANLNNSNTSFSSINKSKNVWWFTVPVEKFESQVNLLLKIDIGVFWIVLDVGFVDSIQETFRIRQDRNAVDLEINAGSNNFLCDVKSKGVGFDFKELAKEVIVY